MSMEKINLWLDDIRPAPEGWLWVKNVEEAKEAFLNHEVVDASLDHDLGLDQARELWANGHRVFVLDNIAYADIFSEESGYTLVQWMAENNIWPKTLSIHSSNPVGAANMAHVIDSRGPYFRKYSYEWDDQFVKGWIWQS